MFNVGGPNDGRPLEKRPSRGRSGTGVELGAPATVAPIATSRSSHDAVSVSMSLSVRIVINVEVEIGRAHV